MFELFNRVESNHQSICGKGIQKDNWLKENNAGDS